MSPRQTNDELLRRKRELHMQIGRSRRRFDAQWIATKQSSVRLCSWRTYVVRYPGISLVAALGAGLAASSLLKPRRVSGWLGRTLLRQAFGGMQQQLWAELHRIWTNRSSGNQQSQQP